MKSNQYVEIRRGIRHIAQAALAAFAICAIAATNAYAQSAAKRAASKQSKAVETARMILEAERLLSALGYWTGPVDSRMDVASRHALVAFQKVEGRQATGRLTAAELEALRGASRPSPVEGGPAHIEVDLERQVLFVVDEGGVVSRVLPVSSGNGEEFTSEGWTRRAVTPTGRFKVSRKINGPRRSPLGVLYYPNYYLSGIAIHGAPSVPAYPASHGCVRIPMFAAKQLQTMTPVGTTVIVHGDATALARKKPASASHAKTSAMRQR